MSFLAGAWALPLPAQAQAQPQSASFMASPLVENRAAAVECLTTAIAYEAATEPVEGQQAVAQVIMNRTRNPSFPANVCGVIYQGAERRTGCQFSFTCDGSLRRRMSVNALAAARIVAEAAVDGALPDRVGRALFYHAHYVQPYWAPSLNRVGRIGAHIFYRRPDGGAVSAMPIPVASALTVPAADIPARPFAPWGLAVASEGGVKRRRIN